MEAYRQGKELKEAGHYEQAIPLWRKALELGERELGPDPNQLSLVRSGFEKTCAACHGGQMAQREMVVLRLPEFEDSSIDLESVVDAFSPVLDEFGAMEAPAGMIEAQLGHAPDRDPGSNDLPAFSSLPPAETIRDAPACGTCHAGGAADVSGPIHASLLASDTEYDSTWAAPPATGGVVVAAISDDVYVAELSSTLDDGVDFISAHEDKIDPDMDVILRDAMGVARDPARESSADRS